MNAGIIVCGLNGSGKSTLGRALAKAIEFHFSDCEDLYFPKTDPQYIYASPRSRTEAEKRLMTEVREHQNFVLAAVKGDFGKDILPFYRCAVLISVPKEIRMKRVRNRSFQKFGERMLPGGDLYEQEEAFFKMAELRTEREVEEWVQSLDCRIIRVDGTKPVEENIVLIKKRIICCD